MSTYFWGFCIWRRFLISLRLLLNPWWIMLFSRAYVRSVGSDCLRVNLFMNTAYEGVELGSILIIRINCYFYRNWIVCAFIEIEFISYCRVKLRSIKLGLVEISIVAVEVDIFLLKSVFDQCGTLELIIAVFKIIKASSTLSHTNRACLWFNLIHNGWRKKWLPCSIT